MVEEAVEGGAVLEHQGPSAMFLVGTPNSRVIGTTRGGSEVAIVTQWAKETGFHSNTCQK